MILLKVILNWVLLPELLLRVFPMILSVQLAAQKNTIFLQLIIKKSLTVPVRYSGNIDFLSYYISEAVKHSDSNVKRNLISLLRVYCVLL